MRTFGLIGFPLAHSFSQNYFTEKFARENMLDCEFINFPIENISDFPALLKNNSSLCGLSVTIPHKQNVINYLDELEDTAKAIAAVNCIRVSKSETQKTVGYNTDVIGFEESLRPLLKPQHRNALILGTGGAAKAVVYVLRKLNINFLFVSKSKDRKDGSINYSDLNLQLISEHTLIINTTPLGMFPDTNECPDIPYKFLSDKHLLYDVIYNPDETLFLKKGKEKGAQTKNGLEMLHLQAEKAWEIWNS